MKCSLPNYTHGVNVDIASHCNSVVPHNFNISSDFRSGVTHGCDSEVHDYTCKEYKSKATVPDTYGDLGRSRGICPKILLSILFRIYKK